MYAIHLSEASEENWEGMPFLTLLPPEIGGQVEIYQLTVNHRNLHLHETENQIYILQSGRGIMEIGNEKKEVGPGWTVYIPCGELHALTPLDGEPIVLLSIKHSLT